jgi:hypothetical protein
MDVAAGRRAGPRAESPATSTTWAPQPSCACAPLSSAPVTAMAGSDCLPATRNRRSTFRLWQARNSDLHRVQLEWSRDSVRDCTAGHACDHELYLPVVNSPRSGVCGYTAE